MCLIRVIQLSSIVYMSVGMLCVFRVCCGKCEYGVDHGGRDNAKKMEESMHKGRFAKRKH
jgi:hypothetical protein